MPSGSSGRATSTGASGGAGAGPGGGGSGGAVDPCANTLFCDDFESYAAGSAPGAPWSLAVTSGGTVVVATDRAHSGSNSVKASLGVSGAYGAATMSFADPNVFPVIGNVIFGRMMFYLESSPDTDITWAFIEGGGIVPNQTYHATYRYGGRLARFDGGGTFIGNQFQALYDTPDSYQTPPMGPSTNCWHDSTGEVIPTGKWTCAEWAFDGPNDTMRFWLDGQPVPSLTVTGTGDACVEQAADYEWTAPTFAYMNVGWSSSSDTDARTIWIDDVALGSERLGCPP
jgi:hypothetical protein